MERAEHSLGVEVEEPLFLDEPADYGATAAARDATPALDLFADENAVHDNHRAVIAPSQVPAPPPFRVNLLAVFFLVAAVAAFVTVRACQVGAVSLTGMWQFFGR
jgi:hypothetical protein